MNETNKPSNSIRSPRIQQKRERTRQEILIAARNIMLSAGVDALTLASVAAELSLTKQALYHYFPSKEALLKNLIAALLNDEIETILAAVNRAEAGCNVLGVVIRAFYAHYIHDLESFRAIYGQSQLLPMSAMGMDETTLREEINPRTRHLFDVLEDQLTTDKTSPAERRRMRRLAFSAWLAALGLMTMLSVADSAQDPLIYSDEELLDTLTRLYDNAV